MCDSWLCLFITTIVVAVVYDTIETLKAGIQITRITTATKYVRRNNRRKSILNSEQERPCWNMGRHKDSKLFTTTTFWVVDRFKKYVKKKWRGAKSSNNGNEIHAGKSWWDGEPVNKWMTSYHHWVNHVRRHRRACVHQESAGRKALPKLCRRVTQMPDLTPICVAITLLSHACLCVCLVSTRYSSFGVRLCSSTWTFSSTGSGTSCTEIRVHLYWFDVWKWWSHWLLICRIVGTRSFIQFWHSFY